MKTLVEACKVLVEAFEFMEKSPPLEATDLRGKKFKTNDFKDLFHRINNSEGFITIKKLIDQEVEK